MNLKDKLLSKFRVLLGSWVRVGILGTIVGFVMLIVVFLKDPAHLLVTPDQTGQRLMKRNDYTGAAEAFADPYRQAIAWFRAGEFERAANIFQGTPGADAAYNHGNALMMLGKYEPAAERFERALQLRPGWEDAEINRSIALARAQLLKQEGGEGTGGMLGADAIVFNEQPSRSNQGDDFAVEGEKSGDDASMQNLWLRQVQTTPSDFLKTKFSYQVFSRNQSVEGTGE